MGKEVILFKSEEKRTLSETAQFLRQLADRVEEGQVILRQGGEELVLTIPQTVTLEVKAEDEATSTGSKYSLEVELEWRPGADGEAGAPLELG